MVQLAVAFIGYDIGSSNVMLLLKSSDISPFRVNFPSPQFVWSISVILKLGFLTPLITLLIPEKKSTNNFRKIYKSLKKGLSETLSFGTPAI